MEETHEYVEKLKQNKEKAARNYKQGNGHPEKKLPNKQHSKR